LSTAISGLTVLIWFPAAVENEVAVDAAIVAAVVVVVVVVVVAVVVNGAVTVAKPCSTVNVGTADVSQPPWLQAMSMSALLCRQ
jgi:hypothetical protein